MRYANSQYIPRGFLTGIGKVTKKCAKRYGLIVGIDSNILTICSSKTGHIYMVYRIVDNERLQLSAFQIQTQKDKKDFIHFATIIINLTELRKVFKLLSTLLNRGFV